MIFRNSYGFGFIKKYEYTKKLEIRLEKIEAESPLTYFIVLVADCQA